MRRLLIISLLFCFQGCCPPFCSTGSPNPSVGRSITVANTTVRQITLMVYYPCYAYYCCQWQQFQFIPPNGSIIITCAPGQVRTFRWSPDGNVCGAYAQSFSISGTQDQNSEIYLY